MISVYVEACWRTVPVEMRDTLLVVFHRGGGQSLGSAQQNQMCSDITYHARIRDPVTGSGLKARARAFSVVRPLATNIVGLAGSKTNACNAQTKLQYLYLNMSCRRTLSECTDCVINTSPV